VIVDVVEPEGGVIFRQPEGKAEVKVEQEVPA
jgi:hypothetical protein